MPRIYLNQRVEKDTLDKLRKFETKQKLKPSISNSLDYLLRFHKLVEKQDKELAEKINSALN